MAGRLLQSLHPKGTGPWELDRLVFGLAALGALLALPSGVEAWFDGLPLSRRPETLAAAVFIPLLLLLGVRGLRLPLAAAGLAILVALKLGLLVAAPPSGLTLRVYASPQDLAAGRWEPTYATRLFPGTSDILDKPLTHGREFPIEWLNREPPPPDGKYWLGLELEGWARIPAGARLVLAAGGVDQAKASLTDPQGKELPLAMVPNLGAAAAEADTPATPGAWRVKARLVYSQDNWSLIPALVFNDGRVEPAFKQGALWRSQAGAGLTDGRLKLLGLGARALDYGLVAFLLAWALWTAWHLRKRGVWDLPLMFLCLLAIILPRFLHDPFPDGIKIIPLGAGLAAVSLLMALYSLWRPEAWLRRKRNLGLTVLAVLGPGFLAWFFELYSGQIGRMSFFSQGDDWLTYQNLAREIFISGDWLDCQRGVWHLQPLYRYVVGGLHFLFGQSALAQDLLDIWSALGAAALLAGMAARLSLKPFSAFIGVALFLTAELGGDFRGHLSRGLQEHLAMLLMLLAGWTALAWGRGGIKAALLAGCFAVLGYWQRQDHLGVLAAMGVLCWEPVTGRFLAAWRAWFAALWRRRGWLALYLGILAAGVLAVGVRNWFCGDLFTLASPTNLARHVGGQYGMGTWGGFYMVLSGGLGPPGWTALILAPGAFLGLLALILRRGFLAGYPLGLGVCLAGLLAIYLVVTPGTSYPPRYSLHLLPLAALSLAVGLDCLFAWLGRR